MTKPIGPHSTVQKVADTRIASDEIPVDVAKIQGSMIPETVASIRTNRPKVNSGRFQSSNTASDSRKGQAPAISTPTYGIISEPPQCRPKKARTVHQSNTNPNRITLHIHYSRKIGKQ